MTTYTVSVTVTEQELESAQYGNIQDMERLSEKIIEAAKKQGYKPSMGG